MHAWSVIGTLREPAAFGGWIAAIARRRALDLVRRGPQEVPLDDRHANRDSPDYPSKQSKRSPRFRIYRKLREPLLLRLVEGCSGREMPRRAA